MTEIFEIEKTQAYEATAELCEKAGLRRGQILVVGCSSSEICGERIGSGSSVDAARAVFEGISAALRERGVFLAAQCCEHLNRAIVIEREAVPGREISSTPCPSPRPADPSPPPPTAGLRIPSCWRRSGPTRDWISAIR